jgi:HSP90 family molecular chaperone
LKKKKAIEPSAVETTSNQLIENVGKTVGKIDVEISYHIIELFSAGLYSSPNKAFEELVSNAYDANAKKVCVNVPADLSIENATLWVCDNGESMNSDGLKQLWKIGSSNKRDNERRKARLQIAPRQEFGCKFSRAS